MVIQVTAQPMVAAVRQALVVRHSEEQVTAALAVQEVLVFTIILPEQSLHMAQVVVEHLQQTL
jgi:hypothetical protein